jgi:hypothetical protein
MLDQNLMTKKLRLQQRMRMRMKIQHWVVEDPV